MRLVADTNVLVSAHLSTHGAPHQIWKWWRHGKISLITSPFILKEVAAVLSRRRIATKYRLSPKNRQTIVSVLRRQSEVVYPTRVEPVVKHDRSDDHILAAAITGKANCIVSGDRHLLKLRRHKNIPIVSVSALIKKMQ